jgi:hypothetical protein
MGGPGKFSGDFPGIEVVDIEAVGVVCSAVFVTTVVYG